MARKVRIATVELRRSAARYSLLSGAVALLLLLLLFLTSLSGALVLSIVGAVENQTADVLVYNRVARRNIEASRLEPSVVNAVAGVDGVAAAAAWNAATFTAVDADANEGDDGLNVTVIGFEPGGPGAPDAVSGPPLRTGTAYIDAGNTDAFAVGSTVAFQGSDTSFEITGTAQNAGFLVQPTLWVALDTYDVLQQATYPQAQAYPINVVAVAADSDREPAAVAGAIDAAVAGTESLTRAEAVDSIAGVSQITASFAIIVAATAVIVVLVVGFFFLIFTVQKLGAYTALRAIGARLTDLARPTLAQIAIVVVAGSAVAVAVLAVTFATASFGLPVSLDWRIVAASVGGILAASLIAGLVSIRRIASADPAEVAGGRNG